MNPSALTPIPLDDAEILRLVATPRRRLFPSLNRASAFAPLILVCCVLPSFQLLSNPALNEEASLWGLRSLAVANATTLDAILQPGQNEDGEPLIFQPPLAAWLNGLVVRVTGPQHLLSTSLVSLGATGVAIWLMTRCAWRFGGAHTALIAALLMCSHPQILESAIVPNAGALGVGLLLASVFGFQRHLERGAPLISPSLFVAGVAWGLSILAIGPIAISLPLIFILSEVVSARRQNAGGGSQSDWTATFWTGTYRTAFQSALIFVVIGLAIGGWWEVLMFSRYGFGFLHSWLSGVPLECLTHDGSEWTTDLCPVLKPSLGDWFVQSSMLVAWLPVGLWRAWRECYSSPDEQLRRRYQFLLYWWALTFVGRVVAEITGLMTVTNTSVWNLALIAPTILLACLGIGSLIERVITERGEFVLIVVVVGLSLARVTASWITGLLSAGLVTLMIVYGPRLMTSFAASKENWTESSWSRLLKITVYSSLAASLWAGFGMRHLASSDEDRLADLKTRLVSLPEVRRVSLIASRDPIPVGLRHLLRCRWPHAEIVATEGWDAGLTEAMDAEGQTPQSRFLVLEWTRRDVRVSANKGQAWQDFRVGNPIRFYGRRLSLVLIEPRA